MSNIREGVGENTILELIADLKKLIDGLTNSKDNPLVALQDAREAIEDLSYQEVELMGNPEKEDELKQIREQKKQLKDKMEEIIKDNDEALKAANSIDEVQDLLNEVEEENNNRFVDGSKIKQRIEYKSPKFNRR